MTDGLAVVHVIWRPKSTLFAASNAVAENAKWSPTVSETESDGVTSTRATATWRTVRDVLSTTPPLAATMLAIPVDTPVASPVALIVATEDDLLIHVTGAPFRTAPCRSRTVAKKWSVSPRITEELRGAMVTEATMPFSMRKANVSDFPF